MTAQTVTGAVATRDKADQLVTWMRRQQDDIAMAAASHVRPSAVIRVTQGALRRDPKLLAAAIANPQSLLYALLDCARLGHEPDTDDYYLVPFGNEVTGIEGYKGIIERMYRAGRVSSVVAEVVRQHDVYRRTGPTTPPVHEFDEFADPGSRGPLRGAYAYAVMLDGRFSKVITMGRAEVMKHKAESRGSDRADSPWQKWEESMWKKCPLRGLEPYVPTSTEYRAIPVGGEPAAFRRIEHEQADFRYLPPPPASVPDGEIVQAEIIEDDQPPAQANGGGPQPKPAARTARRKTAAAGDDTRGQPRGQAPRDAGDSTAQDASPGAAGAAPDRGAQPLPPLPGEVEDPGPAPSGQPAGQEPAAGRDQEPDESDYDTPGTATTPQITAIWTVLSTVFKFGKDEKDQARAVCAHVTGRPLQTTKDMSRNEARTVLDTLASWREVAGRHEEQPRGFLIELLATAEKAGDGDGA